MILHLVNSWKSKRREKKKLSERSPLWDNIRDHYLKQYPRCAACNSNKNLQVHHIKPFKTHPHLELDKTNLIVLCMSRNDCHLKLGHGNNFKMYNPNIIEHVNMFKDTYEGDGRILSKRALRKAIQKMAIADRKL